MPIASIQTQIQQLQTQLKLSQSPKQAKVLESAIARLEEKLKEEAAIPKLEQQFLLLQQMSLASVQANSQSDYLNLQSNLQ